MQRGAVYFEELLPVKRAALAARGVAVDTHVLGEQRVRRTAYFNELARSVGPRRMADHLRTEIARRRRETSVLNEAFARDERLEAELHVLYLIFNEGYASSSGSSVRLAAVRAHLYEKLGDNAAAIAQYRQAADRTSSIPERNYLLLKAARLGQSS